MSETIAVVLELALKPEAVEDFCRQIPITLEETRRFEGFVDIAIRRHAEDPNRIVMIEEWASRSAYEAYVAFRTESGVMDQLAAALTDPPRTTCWTTRIA